MPSNINARYVVNGDDILLDTNAIVRRTEGLKTPDAIVAATAIVHGLPWSLPISDLTELLI